MMMLSSKRLFFKSLMFVILWFVHDFLLSNGRFFLKDHIKDLELSHLKVERRNFINTNHSKRISFCVCSVNTIFITVDFEHEAKTKQRVVLFWYFSFAYTSSFYILPVEKRIHSSLDHSLIYVFLASWPQRLTWTTLLSQPKEKRN